MEYYNLVAFNACFREMEHFELYTCMSTSEALFHLYRHVMDILIIDQMAPDRIGIEFLSHMTYQPLKIIATAYSNNDLLERAKLNGIIFEYINKPWNSSQLLHLLENAANHCINSRKCMQEERLKIG